MEFFEALEELAVASNSYQEATSEEIDKWGRLFGYSALETPDIIASFRADLNRRRLTKDQWNLFKDSNDAIGHDQETYEHQLQLWSTKSKTSTRPRACDDQAFFIFKLGAPFSDIQSLQSAVGISATLRKGLGEEGDADFAHITGSAKRAIEDWIETQSPRPPRPNFIRLSQSRKDLSDMSCHPSLGVDASLPQHRLQDSPCHAPAQTEYPVWYLFYGTLMDPQTVQKCISLPSTSTRPGLNQRRHPPELGPQVQGSRGRTA